MRISIIIPWIDPSSVITVLVPSLEPKHPSFGPYWPLHSTQPRSLRNWGSKAWLTAVWSASPSHPERVPHLFFWRLLNKFPASEHTPNDILKWTIPLFFTLFGGRWCTLCWLITTLCFVLSGLNPRVGQSGLICHYALHCSCVPVAH